MKSITSKKILLLTTGLIASLTFNSCSETKMSGGSNPAKRIKQSGDSVVKDAADYEIPSGESDEPSNSIDHSGPIDEPSSSNNQPPSTTGGAVGGTTTSDGSGDLDSGEGTLSGGGAPVKPPAPTCTLSSDHPFFTKPTPQIDVIVTTTGDVTERAVNGVVISSSTHSVSVDGTKPSAVISATVKGPGGSGQCSLNVAKLGQTLLSVKTSCSGNCPPTVRRVSGLGSQHAITSVVKKPNNVSPDWIVGGSSIGGKVASGGGFYQDISTSINYRRLPISLWILYIEQYFQFSIQNTATGKTKVFDVEYGVYIGTEKPAVDRTIRGAQTY